MPEEEIYFALVQLAQMNLVLGGTQNGYVLSSELFGTNYKPLLVELEKKFGKFQFDLFALYDNQSERVSASSSRSAMCADYSQQIDYVGTGQKEEEMEMDLLMLDEIDEILNNLEQ